MLFEEVVSGIPVRYPRDCGNAPKKEILKDLHMNFVKQDEAAILSQLADGVLWKIHGQKTIKGKGELAKELKKLSAKSLEFLELSHVLTHGKDTAANGIIRYQHGVYNFCHIILFSSAGKNSKIKEIITYVIKEKVGDD